MLFKTPSFEFIGVAPDGQRFRIMRRAEPEPTPGVRVVQNWLADVKSVTTR